MKNWRRQRVYYRIAGDIWPERKHGLLLVMPSLLRVPIRFSFRIMALAIASLPFGATGPALGDEPPSNSTKSSIERFSVNGVDERKNLEVGEPIPVKGKMAFVSAPKTLIYSGPAEEFYPTAQLQQGTAVEVFHRTQSGWAAIRPPTGSFSWIPASEVFLLPGGKTAEVTTNNSVSWIGTSLGTANQYRWQVRLNKGEQLVVTKEETVKDADGRESLWYRISPPSGEFRWIQTGAIANEPPATIAKRADDTTDTDRVPNESGENDVQPAGHNGIIIQGAEGDIVDPVAITDGEVILDGEIVDGGVYYEDPSIESEFHEQSQLIDQPNASWDDWQLFEFTDEGLRFPLWERSLAKQANLHDPLQHDPFSLAMTPKAKGPRLRSAMHDDMAAPGHRRRTAWRDPRTLAQQRLQGYPQASIDRGSGATLSAIRDSFNSTGSGPSSSPIQPADINGQIPMPEYYRDLNQPRPAPSLDQGSGTTAIGSGIAQGLAGSENWLSRNWNGLQQQIAVSGPSIVNAGSTALMQLQNRLNEIVIQPMLQWNFGAIKGQVQQLIQSGQSPVERGQARLLLERIEAFEQLASNSGYPLASYSDNNSVNFGQFGSVAPPFAAPPLVSTAGYERPYTDDFSTRQSGSFPASGIGGYLAASLEKNSQTAAGTIPFEATGWLVPVFATTAGQPSHAITDDSGRIVAYVTGLPGMNLDRYINQAVGIHGLRGYLPQLQAAHIEAQNVVRVR